MGQHLIHTQRLDLRYHNETQAKTDMDWWSGWYQRELLPVIAEVLDELEIPGKTIRLEKLEIDLGQISGKPDSERIKRVLRETLKTQVLRQHPKLLRTESSNLNQTPGQSPTRDKPNDLEHLAYLLEKGRQPWWSLPSKKAGIRYFFQELFGDKNAMFKKWLKSQPLSFPAAQRLVHHVSYKELVDLIAWVFPESVRTWELFSKSLKDVLSPEIFSKAELEGLLSEILTEAFLVEKSLLIHAVSTWLRSNLLSSQADKVKSRELLLPLLELICEKKPQFPNTSIGAKIIKKWWGGTFVFSRNAASQKEKESTSHQKIRSIQNLDTDEAFPIFNAGLVLTAPFLLYFFRGLGLVETKEFVSTQAQHRAALLIQSLLDESFAYEESDLLLNKILCGIQPDEPIPVSFSPTELEKEEILNLLNAMAGQWTALRSTSGRNLAKGFFPREGSLRRADKGYRLHIPRISIDILLNRLPWTISIVKLPWMNETLFTEW